MLTEQISSSDLAPDLSRRWNRWRKKGSAEPRGGWHPSTEPLEPPSAASSRRSGGSSPSSGRIRKPGWE